MLVIFPYVRLIASAATNSGILPRLTLVASLRQHLLPLLGAHGAEMTVANKAALMFVPQAERKGFEALQKRDGFNRLKQRFGLMAFLQVVIGNPCAQMMNVMKPDVAGKPLENFR